MFIWIFLPFQFERHFLEEKKSTKKSHEKRQKPEKNKKQKTKNVQSRYESSAG